MTIMADALTILLTTLNCCSNVGNTEAVISSPSVKCVILEGALRHLSMQTIGLQGLWHTNLLSALQWLSPLTKVIWVTKYGGKQTLKCSHSITFKFVFNLFLIKISINVLTVIFGMFSLLISTVLLPPPPSHRGSSFSFREGWSSVSTSHGVVRG